MGSEISLEIHPEIEGLTLFSAPPGPHEHAVHAHDAYSVIVLYDGAKDFHHQGKTISVAALQIAVANPGELHGCVRSMDNRGPTKPGTCRGSSWRNLHPSEVWALTCC